MLYYYMAPRFLEMISGDEWIKFMELFVAWKNDDEIGRPEGRPSMWQPRKGCDIGNVDIVIAKKGRDWIPILAQMADRGCCKYTQESKSIEFYLPFHPFPPNSTTRYCTIDFYIL